jgi:hypothetical protein
LRAVTKGHGTCKSISHRDDFRRMLHRLAVTPGIATRRLQQVAASAVIAARAAVVEAAPANILAGVVVAVIVSR